MDTKSAYIKPSFKVVAVTASHLICTSPEPDEVSYGTSKTENLTERTFEW